MAEARRARADVEALPGQSLSSRATPKDLSFVRARDGRFFAALRMTGREHRLCDEEGAPPRSAFRRRAFLWFNRPRGSNQFNSSRRHQRLFLQGVEGLVLSR